MASLLGFIAKLPLILGVFLAGIKSIGAMMLPFDCNTSQPIPNKLAYNYLSKNGEDKFNSITKISGPFKKRIDYFSLTARSQQKRTVLVSIPMYICPNVSFVVFSRRFFFLFFFSLSSPLYSHFSIYTSENIAVL